MAAKTNSNRVALTGFVFSLPFIITNFIVSLRIEPFYSFLGSFPFIRNTPIFPLFLLLLFPIGALISIKPMLKKSAKAKSHIANIIVSVGLVLVFLILFTGLAGEMYRCEVLKIPNCD